ncbi:uncharacterized protein LOC126810060 isoform X2 [Patella vulgata]|uniref:uncharacterized protein LOC126810060 isoform X2 n=1 Tax=Patella vulgata TaxID=6465 RepID=UPI00217FA925|nr:uncharacterized protein LOC126810060 isoform X2 [Patella vulgata]
MGEIGDLLSQYFVRLASFQGLINENQASDSDCHQQTRVGNNIRPNVSVSDRTSFIKLARAGFYYAGPVEGIQCFVCKSKARYLNWNNESPVAVHRILNPYCPFLQSPPASCSSENNICCNSTTIESPATDGHVSNHCCTNSQQPDNPTQLQEPSDDRGEVNGVSNSIRQDETPPNGGSNANTTRQSLNSVRRNLFCASPAGNQSNLNVDNNEPTDNNIIGPQSQWSDHVEEYAGRLTLPKIGDKLFNSYESFRILTYPNPQDETAGEWAAGGFVYVDDDKVQCVYCAGIVTSYREQLNIIEVHEKISPKGRYCCPMVSGIDVGNVSRKLEELVRKKLINKNNRPKYMKTGFRVLHPQYRSMEERLASLRHWPKQYKPTKTQLAEAGFFHTGVVTKVICFSCGLSIRDWEPEAEPWQQHALISPTCGFIKFIKGEEFILQMAAIQQLVEVDPSVTEAVTSIGELNIPDPYPPTLNTTLLAAYSTCGRYPSVEMLKAAVLADGELKKHVDIIDLQGEQLQTKDKQLDSLDQVMTVKDQYYKTTVASLNQHHNIIIDCKEQEYIQQLNHKDQEYTQQLNHKDQEYTQQLNHKDQEYTQQLNQASHELNQQSQQLNHYRCTKRQLRQQIREKDDHIENLSNRLQTAVDRHRSREDNLQQTFQTTLQQQTYIHQTQLQRKQTELETETAQLQAEIQKYEEELSNLVTEFTRIKSTVNKRENQQENQQPDSTAVNQPDPSAINPDRCLICLSETRVVLFRPCKHVCCCTTCAPHFMDSPCPICRTTVQDWEIVFLS